MPKKDTKWYKNWSITKITTIVGTLAGIVSIIAFSGTIFDKIGKYIVTDNELALVENRIIKKFEKEALTIRQVYIEDLLSQKNKLSELLISSKTEGEAKFYELKIESINRRIERLRGTE